MRTMPTSCLSTGAQTLGTTCGSVTDFIWEAVMVSGIRIDRPTPSGGDYSEIVFFDDKFAIVDESEATRCVIRECKADGTLVCEAWGS